jgi:hypothetical protein
MHTMGSTVIATLVIGVVRTVMHTMGSTVIATLVIGVLRTVMHTMGSTVIATLALGQAAVRTVMSIRNCDFFLTIYICDCLLMRTSSSLTPLRSESIHELIEDLL